MFRAFFLILLSIAIVEASDVTDDVVEATTLAKVEDKALLCEEIRQELEKLASLLDALESNSTTLLLNYNPKDPFGVMDIFSISNKIAVLYDKFELTAELKSDKEKLNILVNKIVSKFDDLTRKAKADISRIVTAYDMRDFKSTTDMHVYLIKAQIGDFLCYKSSLNPFLSTCQRYDPYSILIIMNSQLTFLAKSAMPRSYYDDQAFNILWIMYKYYLAEISFIYPFCKYFKNKETGNLEKFKNLINEIVRNFESINKNRIEKYFEQEVASPLLTKHMADAEENNHQEIAEKIREEFEIKYSYINNLYNYGYFVMVYYGWEGFQNHAMLGTFVRQFRIGGINAVIVRSQQRTPASVTSVLKFDDLSDCGESTNNGENLLKLAKSISSNTLIKEHVKTIIIVRKHSTFLPIFGDFPTFSSAINYRNDTFIICTAWICKLPFCTNLATDFPLDEFAIYYVFY